MPTVRESKKKKNKQNTNARAIKKAMPPSINCISGMKIRRNTPMEIPQFIRGFQTNHSLASKGSIVCISFLEPAPDSVLYDFFRHTVFFPRPANDFLAMIVPVAPRRQCPRHKRIAVFTVFQNLDADFVIVQIHEPPGRICAAEFSFKNFRVTLPHTKGDQ